MRVVNQRVNASDFLGPLSSVEEANAPKRLCVSGDTAIMMAGLRVAVVGTRKPSEAGRRRTHRLATMLAKRGVVVVSGLAKGVDTIAHKAAISAGGRTMAVIGTALSKAYPAENRELQNRIAEEHLLVSEFEEGSSGGRWTFPKRNRTMALLSDATVIIEAGLKSGTENQGWEAIRLGRPLLLLQSLLDTGHPWLKRLLDYGAVPLSDDNFDDVMAELPPTKSREAEDAVF
ncbi:MAG: DNA processing protein DprA [Planctomycetota bacterium]|nr:MAG: DNA processing protein DprA [Planctomycetota bacterium]